MCASQDTHSLMRHGCDTCRFDSMFNIILLTILLNVIAGIIIDTFAELREKKSRQEEDMQVRGTAWCCGAGVCGRQG